MGGHEKRSADPAAGAMLELAARQGLETVWDRLERQRPQCPLGEKGICCSLCLMGPCRINPRGSEPRRGVCGADADAIVARNLLRMVAAGTASHSDHGRKTALMLREVAAGRNSEYRIGDLEKLGRVALRLGITTRGKGMDQVALEVAEAALADFGRQENGPLLFLRRYMPGRRQRALMVLEDRLSGRLGTPVGLLPRGIDREVVEALHRTNYGTDHDPWSLLLQGVRCALADGWGGSLIATELQDILFGTPAVREVTTNLGVIDAAYVNIVLHGHEPLLSEKIVEAVRSEEMQEAARRLGARGIKLIGMCCTVNEVLMRQGIEVAGNHLHQELAIMTGAVEALVVDVQCIFPAMADLAAGFHTRFISTSPQALFPGGIHIPFEHGRAGEIARTIVATAVEAFPQRNREQVHIPRETATARVGFGVEEIIRHLGGSLEPLASALVSGRIRGIAGIVGCNNPKVRQDHLHINLTRELISRDILVVGTGCWAIGVAKAGLMDMKVLADTSPGLGGFCAAHGIPPVLHMGSCVDCSRILLLFGALSELLGKDLPQLPLVAAAPEWATEKALAIALYFAASGLPVHLWPAPPISGSRRVGDILTAEMGELFGGYFFVEEEPRLAAERLAECVEERRRGAGFASNRRGGCPDTAP